MQIVARRRRGRPAVTQGGHSGQAATPFRPERWAMPTVDRSLSPLTAPGLPHQLSISARQHPRVSIGHDDETATVLVHIPRHQSTEASRGSPKSRQQRMNSDSQPTTRL